MADISRTVYNPRRWGKIVPITAARTLKPSESGQGFYINTTTQTTVTLPKINKNIDGVYYTVIVGALAGSGSHTVSPATGDTIQFAAAGTASATASESLLFTAATDNVGQYVTLVAVYNVGWVPVGFGTTASLSKA